MCCARAFVVNLSSNTLVYGHNSETGMDICQYRDFSLNEIGFKEKVLFIIFCYMFERHLFL